MPTHRQTVDYSNTFYIEKRDIENYLLFLWLNYSDKMNRIKEVLEEKGIKQTWLAEQLGKSYNMVNGYVQNRQQPRIEVLYEIAEILGVSVKELLIDNEKGQINEQGRKNNEQHKSTKQRFGNIENKFSALL